MPYVSTYGIVYSPLFVGYSSCKVFDSGWRELFGGQGFYFLFVNLSRVNQWWQYNSLKVFLLFFVMWVIILIFIFCFYLNGLFRA
jgi:hypothetical protein